MKTTVLQRVVLALAATVFGAFIICYLSKMDSGIVAFGTLSPVLLLFAMFLGAKPEEEEIPMDETDKEEEQNDKAHVDQLIEQAVKRREQIEEQQRKISDAEGKLETLSQRVVALESENMELADELSLLRNERESLNKELRDTKGDLDRQRDKVKDASISILPITAGENPKILEIADVAISVVKEYSEAADKAGIRIQISNPDKALLVKADEKMMEVLFQNIIDNAIKYMGKNGTFQITISDIGEDLFIVAKDNGEGLSSDETDHIFELNFQGSNRVSGNGLGLAQARAIVEYYGGMIYARSSKGNGMGIYIHLPSAK